MFKIIFLSIFNLVVITIFFLLSFETRCLYGADSVITYTDMDGKLKIVYPVLDIRLENESEEQLVQRIANKDVPKNVPYEIMEITSIPKSRRFRNAWKLNGKNVEIDIDKAREIRRKELLELRDKKMEKEEILLDKAVDEEDKQTEKLIRNKRIELRKLDSLDLSNIPMNELDSYVPETLK